MFTLYPISGVVFIILTDGTVLECCGPVYIRRNENE